MLTVLRWVLRLFIIVFGLTALLTLSGVVYLWFFNPQAQMPYLRWLLSLTIAEAVGAVVVLGSGASTICRMSETTGIVTRPLNS